MIPRDTYLQQIISFKDTELIKVVTGIRRCGKSTLFELYQAYLLDQGVSKEQIIAINLEDGDYINTNTSQELYALVQERLLPNKTNYIFLDEVQQVADFQKAVDSLFVKKSCDLYITGSNAHLLSGELATLLSGRYVEIKMLPLSFREYSLAYPQETNMEKLYHTYVQYSSFPYTTQLKDKKAIAQYLSSLYDSIVLKDIIARKQFQNIEMLHIITRFLFDNIGNSCSTKKIADTLTSGGKKISANTVDSYLEELTNSFIFHKADRYDIKGKQYLKTHGKYYATDIGLRQTLLGRKPADRGHILENIVYLELLRRYEKVYIGKVGTKEVDFIAQGIEGTASSQHVEQSDIAYYQVAYTLIDADGSTLERELRSLQAIKDHNPKYLLTMDYTPPTSYNGIQQLNVLDWLLN